MALDQQESEILILKAKLYDTQESVKQKDKVIEEVAAKLDVSTYDELMSKLDDLIEKPAS